MRHFQIFDKIDSFLKKCFKCPWQQKWYIHLWGTAECTYNCLLAFFLFRCGCKKKIGPSWRNYLIWTADWGGQHNTPDTQNKLNIFLSAIAVTQVIFWTKVNFCFVFDCRDSFNCKLKKLINEQIIIFYSSSNALCSFDESVQIKHAKHHAFIGMISFSIWFNLQCLQYSISVNLFSTNVPRINGLMETQWAINRSIKWVNVRHPKNQVFFSLAYSQSKLKKISTLFLRSLLRKTRYKI